MNKLTTHTQKMPTIREAKGIKTVLEILESSADSFGDRTAYINTQGGVRSEIVYGRVYEKIKKLAKHLRDFGIEKGDRVAVVGKNSTEWAISFFAISWTGATVLPLDPKIDHNAWKFILDFASTSAVICMGDLYKTFEDFKEELKGLKKIIAFESIDDLCEKYSSGYGGENVKPDDLLEILFTSGTTGDPKGVMLTHGNVLSNVEDIYTTVELSPDDKAFSILPIHHVYESTGGLMNAAYNGCSTFFARGIRPREMLEDLLQARPTYWSTSPLILEKMFVRIRKQLESMTPSGASSGKPINHKLSQMIKSAIGLADAKYILSGGAPLPVWVSLGFEELGFPILQGYGLSEASPAISINPPGKPKNGSVGMVIPSCDVEIWEADKSGVGEIAVKGPNVMKGYLNNPDATAEVLTPDGWLKTGDIGFFDDDGYLYITGRKKSVIVTPGGKNIFPEEIEEKLNISELIEECVVFSPDDSSIQTVIFPNHEALASLIKDKGLAENESNRYSEISAIIEQVNESLEGYKKIRKFAMTDEQLPKTTTQKVLRREFKGRDLRKD